MAGYKASKIVGLGKAEFAPYVDFTYDIPEPSTDQIAAYFEGYGAMLRDAQLQLERLNAEQDTAAKIEDPSERIDQYEVLDGKYRTWQRQDTQTKLAIRCQLLAAVCTPEGDSDDATAERQAFREAVMKLPGRVLTDFEGYVQNELGPKGARTDTNSNSPAG